MFKNINYGSQYIDERDEIEVLKALRQNNITQGIYVQKIEKEFQKKIKSKYTVVCNSGTAGLHLALMSINLRKGDNVIIPSINFVAASSICKMMGANIYFCDVDKNTYQANKQTVLNCIKENKIALRYQVTKFG